MLKFNGTGSRIKDRKGMDKRDQVGAGAWEGGAAGTKVNNITFRLSSNSNSSSRGGSNSSRGSNSSNCCVHIFIYYTFDWLLARDLQKNLIFQPAAYPSLFPALPFIYYLCINTMRFTRKCQCWFYANFARVCKKFQKKRKSVKERQSERDRDRERINLMWLLHFNYLSFIVIFRLNRVITRLCWLYTMQFHFIHCGL